MREQVLQRGPPKSMKTAPEILQLLQAQFPEKIRKSEMGV
jgi:hypothetical protein